MFLSATMASVLAAILVSFSLIPPAPAQEADNADGVSGHYAHPKIIPPHDLRGGGLQVLPLSSDKAFVSISLGFGDYHSCTFFGIAEYSSRSLTYEGPTIQGKICKLTIAEESGMVNLKDPSGECGRFYCGADGALENVSFPSQPRKVILDIAEMAQLGQWDDLQARFDEAAEKFRQSRPNVRTDDLDRFLSKSKN